MSSLVYLGIAVVLSVVGCLVLWFRNRRPTSMTHSIQEFARELDALAPSTPATGRRRGRSDNSRGRRSG